MQFKSNICGNSKTLCSPQGSAEHSSHVQRNQDKRVKSLTQVPQLFGVRVAASHVAWLRDFLLFHTDI